MAGEVRAKAEDGVEETSKTNIDPDGLVVSAPSVLEVEEFIARLGEKSAVGLMSAILVFCASIV